MMRKGLKRLIVALLILNSLSFCVARAYWYHSGEVGTRLETWRLADDSEVMNYLVAGCVNQPRSAYDFLLDELEGGVTFVNYQATRGCSMRTIAKQVIADAERHNYQARVIGISIGDYIGRRVEDALPGTESVGINPEPEASILRPWARGATCAGSVLAETLTVPVGWLSVIPWYNGCDNHFSLAFIADQFRDIGLIVNTPKATDGVKGIIISERPGKAEGDEFLKNSAIREYFPGVPVAQARTGHGNTVDGADEFLRAWKELMN